MARTGCFTLIMVVVILLISLMWYKTAYLPEKLAKYVIAHTTNNSSIFKDRSDKNFDRWLNNNFGHKLGLFCAVKNIDNTEFELCVNTTDNPQNNIQNPLADSQVEIKISFPDNHKPIQTTIDMGNYAVLSNSATITSSEKYFFIAWKHHNPSNNIYTIKIKTINKSTGTEISEQNLLSKGFGIENLAIGFSQKTDTLLLAWNDWSCNSSEDLFLGKIRVDDLLNSKKKIMYKQVLTKDKWDKRNPYFLKDGNNLYFAHSTGDHWGIASYNGNLSIGVSLIDAQLEPVQYSIIKAEAGTGKVLKIQNGIIYYTTISANGSCIEEVRTIPFPETFKHATINKLL